MSCKKEINATALTAKIKLWAKELGFAQVGITDTNLAEYSDDFTSWLKNKYHGSMHYMEQSDLRLDPVKLVPNALSIIVVTMPYLTDNKLAKILSEPEQAGISRYALGKDYHKFMRKKLQLLANKINEVVGDFGYRAFADSAPVLEKPLGEKAGLGWVGKNTLLMNKEDGSWFFLGELYTDLPLEYNTKKINDSCGKCKACIKICPTDAIVAEKKLDARKCISYLTIENKESIPLEHREKIGNRIYGCDDCQLICPWNRYAKLSSEAAFQAKNSLDNISLLDLFAWNEQDFLKKLVGSPIRRIGYISWLRNIAVALGNAPYNFDNILALKEKLKLKNNMLTEHISWALTKQRRKQHAKTLNDSSKNARTWQKISLNMSSKKYNSSQR